VLSDAEINQFREEREVDEQWRTVSCHAIAEMIEICSVCGTVRDKDKLVRCPWCPDTYLCSDGVCSEQHRSRLHAAIAYWTW
jgi:hypothetical protein